MDKVYNIQSNKYLNVLCDTYCEVTGLNQIPCPLRTFDLNGVDAW